MSAQDIGNSSDELLVHVSAAAKVQSLIDEEENPKLCLRVFIIGGGCSGFQYGFSFDEAINDDDYVIEKWIDHVTAVADAAAAGGDVGGDAGGDAAGSIAGGETGGGAQQVCVKVLVDMLSMQYLKGAEIDYREDIEGARFIIRNPNAKTTCGCGSSFSA